MFPVPDGGNRDAESGNDVLLPQMEFETAPTQVVAEGNRLLSKLGMKINF
jgi:hypothetical protein